MSGVWGETVNVPKESIPIQSGINWVRTGNPDEGSGDGDRGDGNQDGEQGKTSALDEREAAVSKKELELAQKEAFIEGYMRAQAQLGQAGDGTSKEGEDDTPETPQPEKIVFDEDAHVEGNEETIAEKYNGLVDLYTSEKAKNSETITKLENKLDTLEDTVSAQVFEQNLALVSATTGVTREEIIAKNQETKITDANILAQLILGEKAMKGEELPTTAKDAEKERENATNGITGSSQGGNNSGDGSNKPFRGLDPEKIKLSEKTDGASLAAIAGQYKFAPRLVQNG